jgi:hypothetical protein
MRGRGGGSRGMWRVRFDLRWGWEFWGDDVYDMSMMGGRCMYDLAVLLLCPAIYVYTFSFYAIIRFFVQVFVFFFTYFTLLFLLFMLFWFLSSFIELVT